MMDFAAPLHPDDLPGSLRNREVVVRRRAMLESPHMRPLNAYVGRLADQARGFVPNFDPLDGGTGAKLLFLFEKPGPKTFPPLGSGFISRNNNDPSAVNCRAAMIEAGIPRSGTLTWNTVPWWNKSIMYTGAEMQAGAAEILSLLRILPELRGVVLVGNSAAAFGGPVLEGTELLVFRTVHTSNQARNGLASREAWKRIPELWARAWQAIGESQ